MQLRGKLDARRPRADDAEVQQLSPVCVRDGGLVRLLEACVIGGTASDRLEVRFPRSGGMRANAHSRIRLLILRASRTSLRKWACSLTPGTLNAGDKARSNQRWAIWGTFGRRRRTLAVCAYCDDESVVAYLERLPVRTSLGVGIGLLSIWHMSAEGWRRSGWHLNCM